jgi:hypothetical protein
MGDCGLHAQIVDMMKRFRKHTARMKPPQPNRAPQQQQHTNAEAYRGSRTISKLKTTSRRPEQGNRATATTHNSNNNRRARGKRKEKTTVCGNAQSHPSLIAVHSLRLSLLLRRRLLLAEALDRSIAVSRNQTSSSISLSKTSRKGRGEEPHHTHTHARARSHITMYTRAHTQNQC